MDGDELVVVANRLPIELVRNRSRWRRAPGGLVSAMRPAMAGRSVTWVGWHGISSDEDDPPPALPQERGLRLVDVPLSTEDVREHYDGFSNVTLWPLYHDVVVPPVYRRRLWEGYRRVNGIFADATAESAPHGGLVWVHDYQLQLVPRLLRTARPDLRVGFFLHVPFPPVELFAQLPWRRVVLEGLLGSDLIGLQTDDDVRNLRQAFVALTDCVVGDDWVVDTQTGRRVLLRPFPISVDVRHLGQEATQARAKGLVDKVRADLGNPKTLLLGADRLDYTKGIDIRLKAYVELLEEGRLDPASCVFVQIAAPSREDLEEYQRIRDEVELVIGRALGGFGGIDGQPLRYVRQPMSHARLMSLFAAADVMLVTPLRDGMNLVCKEYVAARVDGDGALVLSEFAGAARELDAAWLVNPYDADAVKNAIEDATFAPEAIRRERMTRLRAAVLDNDVNRWSESFLATLASGRNTRDVEVSPSTV